MNDIPLATMTGRPEITNQSPTDHQEITTIEEGNKEIRKENTYIREFQDYWNEHEALPRIARMTEKRVAALQNKLEDRYFRENWKPSVDALARSDFHTGGGPQGWRADLGWFLDGDNWLKCLETDGMHDPNDSDARARVEIELTNRFIDSMKQEREEVE
jgi:hypothetical protein